MQAATDDVAAAIVVVVVVVGVGISVVVGPKAKPYKRASVKSAVKSSTVEPTASEAAMKAAAVEATASDASMKAAAVEATASDASMKARMPPSAEPGRPPPVRTRPKSFSASCFLPWDEVPHRVRTPSQRDYSAVGLAFAETDREPKLIAHRPEDATRRTKKPRRDAGALVRRGLAINGRRALRNRRCIPNTDPAVRTTPRSLRHCGIAGWPAPARGMPYVRGVPRRLPSGSSLQQPASRQELSELFFALFVSLNAGALWRSQAHVVLCDGCWRYGLPMTMVTCKRSRSGEQDYWSNAFFG